METEKKRRIESREDLTMEDYLKVLEMAKRKIAKRKIKVNHPEEEVQKGAYRNQKCPFCEKKMKKCGCWKD